MIASILYVLAAASFAAIGAAMTLWRVKSGAGLKHGLGLLTAGYATLVSSALVAAGAILPAFAGTADILHALAGMTMFLAAVLIALGLRDRMPTMRREIGDMHRVERRQRALISLVPAMTLSFHPEDEQVTFLNDKVAALLGYSQHELNSNSALFASLLHPNDRDGSGDHAFAAFCSSRAAGAIERRYRHKDGRYRWIRMHGVALCDPDGEVREVLICGFDVTDLKETEAKLIRVIEGAPDAMLVLDECRRIVLTNPKALELLGLEPGTLAGKRIEDLPVSNEADRSALTEHLAEGAAETPGVESINIRRHDRDVPVEVRFSPIGSGSDRAVLCTIRDVSELKTAEAQLRHAQKMEAVGQLTGGLAHDFNNLLTIIIGNLQLLDLELEGREALRPTVHAAFRAAIRGADLTKRLLAFSRRQALAPRRTNPNRLVSELAPLLRRTLGENIALSIELEDGVGTIEVDPGQLENALVNLALNSRDAMPDGGDLVIRTMTEDSDHRSVVITVTDTGAGIPEDLLPRVFEPFFSTKDVGKGTGLGLSMVYGFVRQSEGQISIDSTVGSGTSVRIVLPHSEAEEDSTRSVQTMSQRALPSGDETVLVVEDNTDARHVATTLLAGLGYGVLEASNATEALAVLGEHAEVDLLFTDIVMPGKMSGVELGRLAVERRPKLRVLYVSGYADAATYAEVEKTGGTALLNKPYLSQELAGAVRIALDSPTSQPKTPVRQRAV